MRKTLYLFAFAAMAASPVANVSAQDSTKAPEGKLTFGGYIDSYYLTGFNRPPSGNFMGYSSNTPAAVGYARAFDRLNNQFALGLVQIKTMYSTAKSDMVIDLTFGPNAELGNFGNQRYNGAAAGGYVTGFSPSNANQQGLYGTGAAIKQAYFTYKFTDKWNFTVGQFGTHVGYEVIDAPINYHYSLSNLFNNGPFYHIGVKTNYMISDKFGVMAGIVNNWDAMTDWKSQKSTIAQVFISPLEGMNIYVNYIGGYNDDGFKSYYNVPGAHVANVAYGSTGRGYIRQLLDLTAGWQITDRFYVGVNAALGWYTWQLTGDEKAAGTKFGKGSGDIAYANKAWGKSIFKDSSKFQSWGGIALYTNYKINDMLGIGARYEHFDDRNGLRYINGVNNSLTITMPITLADGHLIIKPEFRWDTGVLGWAASGVNPNAKDADGKQYTTGIGLYETTDVQTAKTNGTSPNQTPTYTSGQSTIGLAFIYKY
jgi:hypothetical protein